MEKNQTHLAFRKLKLFGSSLFHFLLPSKCDFCFDELQNNDYHRICLSCIKKILSESHFLEKQKCSVCYSSLMLENLFTPKNETKQIATDNICQNCLQMNFIFQKNVSLFFYYQLGKKLMTLYKIDKHPSYAILIADLLMKKYRSFFAEMEIIIPIILLRRDLFQRDFCPVWQVLKILQKKYKLPIKKNIIIKNKKYQKKSQHFKNKQQRVTEIVGKYFYNQKYKNALNKKKILIVDDVFTTGSTMNFVAELISKNNNDIKIDSMSFARTIIDEHTIDK